MDKSGADSATNHKNSQGSPRPKTWRRIVASLTGMPAPYEPEGEQRGRRRVGWLFWAGVGVAPLAALLLLLGQGVGPLRAAAVLAVLSVVLIGLSVTLREDVGSVREEFSEELRREVDLVRADVDTLRRGVELTMHRELERVRGELEAARRDTVLHAEATRLPTGHTPALAPVVDDYQTVEPIREEFVRPRPAVANAGASVVRSEPVRVAAARVDTPSTTYGRPGSTTYGSTSDTNGVPDTWNAPSWDSGTDSGSHQLDWQPPAWDEVEQQTPAAPRTGNVYGSTPQPAPTTNTYGYSPGTHNDGVAGITPGDSGAGVISAFARTPELPPASPAPSENAWDGRPWTSGPDAEFNATISWSPQAQATPPSPTAVSPVWADLDLPASPPSQPGYTGQSNASSGYPAPSGYSGYSGRSQPSTPPPPARSDDFELPSLDHLPTVGGPVADSGRHAGTPTRRRYDENTNW